MDRLREADPGPGRRRTALTARAPGSPGAPGTTCSHQGRGRFPEQTKTGPDMRAPISRLRKLPGGPGAPGALAVQALTQPSFGSLARPSSAGANRSPSFARRAGIVRRLKRDGSRPRRTSSHVRGAETGAPGAARSEYGATIVLP